MTLRVVGAGLGRTATLSLKLALEKLLGAPCYHMLEVMGHPDHVPAWHAAARGEMPDWHALLEGYAAAVDWPAAAFWPELSEAFPDALILLSVRPAEQWWESADQTIFPNLRVPPPAEAPEFVGKWHAMCVAMLQARFGAPVDDRNASIAAFRRLNEETRERAPANRLLEWQASDGWEPICSALDLPIPDEPFPRRNDRQEFQNRIRSLRP